MDLVMEPEVTSAPCVCSLPALIQTTCVKPLNALPGCGSYTSAARRLVGSKQAKGNYDTEPSKMCCYRDDDCVESPEQTRSGKDILVKGTAWWGHAPGGGAQALLGQEPATQDTVPGCGL